MSLREPRACARLSKGKVGFPVSEDIGRGPDWSSP